MLSDHQKTLLLVEDEVILAMSKQKDLKKYGYNILTVNTGDKAVAIIKENKNISLVLMDIDLGNGIDGTETAELILKDRDIPIVFLSSHTEKEVVEKTEKITSYGYVVKSSSVTVIDASIKMAFKLFNSHCKIEKGKNLLQKTIDGVGEPILMIDNNYKVLSSNTAVREQYSSNKEYCYQISHNRDIPCYDDPDHPCLLQEVIKTGKLSKTIHKHINKNGESRFVELTASPVFNDDNEVTSIIEISNDITEQMLTENALVTNKIMYKELFQNMNSCVAVYKAVDNGNDFIFVDFNNAAERIDKISKKNILGKKVTEAFPGVEKLEIFNVFKRVWKTGNPENCPIFQYKDNRIEGWRDNFVYKLPSGEIIAIYDDITERKKLEIMIKDQLSEKEIILKEVHHRIKNNFASIGSLLSLQADSLTNPEAISALKEAIGRINSMQILYEKLLITDNYTVTSLKQYLDNLIEDIINLFSESGNITIEKQIEDLQLDSNLLIPIGIIVNEILTNIIKYAFTGKDSGLIEIILKRNNKNIILTIQDNGNGLPKGFDINKQKGFGLMLIKMLTQQLEGSFSIIDNGGTKSTLKFTI